MYLFATATESKVRATRAICPADSFVFTLSHCLIFTAIRHVATRFNRIVSDKSRHRVKPWLHDVICLNDSFVFTLSHCLICTAIRQVSTRFNKIVADKSHHRVKLWLHDVICLTDSFVFPPAH